MKSIVTVPELDRSTAVAAIMRPCDPDAIEGDMTVLLEYADRSQELLRGEEAADFWQIYGCRHP
ncbi:MAG: hypothetical protein KME20_05160 [Kaiparowitsia implicata GSE-PSE-MK54-09C]|nr:hypothetical protein [Kaiparowitsia implicata GSE-PSE-MK54-09C]